MTFDNMFNVLLILMVINIVLSIVGICLLVVVLIDNNYISNTADNINLLQMYDKPNTPPMFKTIYNYDCRDCLGTSFGDCFKCSKYNKNNKGG